MIEALAAMVGTDRLMMGPDFPCDIGDDDPVGMVNKARLSEADREKITFGNAGRLFKIPKVGAWRLDTSRECPLVMGAGRRSLPRPTRSSRWQSPF